MQDQLIRKSEQISVFESEQASHIQEMVKKDLRIEELRKRSYD